MDGNALLRELEAAGIRLRRDGGNLIARARPGVSLAAFRERIRAHKSVLMAALEAPQSAEPACELPPLDRQLVAALACILSRDENDRLVTRL
jgi:hypothetical protein